MKGDQNLKKTMLFNQKQTPQEYEAMMANRRDPKKQKAKLGLFFLGAVFFVMLSYNATLPDKTPKEILDDCFKDCTVQEYLETKKALENEIMTTDESLDEAEQVLLSGVSSGTGEIASGVSEEITNQSEEK